MAFDDQLTASFAAVANYRLDDKQHRHLQLAGVDQVLNELAGSGKHALFLQDVDTHVGQNAPDDEKTKAAVDILAGRHPQGFRMTVVEAAHEGGVVYIPVIEDKERNQLLVVSPVKAEDPERHDAITFVNTGNAGVTRDVNGFFDEGMRLRRQRRPGDESVNQVLEDIALAATIVGGEKKGKKRDDAAPKKKSLGQLLSSVAKNGGVVAYSVAAQRFEDGSLAEKLDPQRFVAGAESGFQLKGKALRLKSNLK